MKTLLLVGAAAIALAATPAFATNINGNYSPGVAQTWGGGNSNANVNNNHSSANATGGVSLATGGTSNATGGRSNATGGASNATGGAGGSSTAYGAGGSGGAGGTSAAGSNLSIAGGVGNVSSTGSARAPDVIVPGGGGMDCPTVGFGASGAGVTGGGGFGPSWISPDCNARKLASMMWTMGYHQEAVQLLQDHFPEVRKAFKQVTASAPAPAAPVASTPPAIPANAPAFCHTAGLALSSYPECQPRT